MQRPEITQSAEARATRARDTIAPPELAVGVLLQSGFATRLAGALVGVASLRELAEIRPNESLDLLVVDPRLLPKHPRAAAAARRFVQAQIPLVYYTSLSRDARLAAAAEHELVPARLVMHGEDDAPATLRELVDIAPRSHHVRLLLQHLDELLERLSQPVRASMVTVVSSPGRFCDAADVAMHAGVSRRHADRSLAAAGLAPTKRWIVAARAWHAVRMLAPGCSVESVAARLGYPDSKALRRHLRAVWGIAPSALASADLSALLAQLIAFLGG
jgi:AraC-like DNA-binding protein